MATAADLPESCAAVPVSPLLTALAAARCTDLAPALKDGLQGAKLVSLTVMLSCNHTLV